MMRILVLFIFALLLGGAKRPPLAQPKPIEKSDFKDIVDRYQFIGDFREKPAQRDVSGEIFWRYPFKIEPQKFPLAMDKRSMDQMIYRVPGDGRMAEHFAKGRIEFLDGQYDQAHATWLSGRMQFDKDPLMNRRIEFFMAVNALQRARELLVIAKGDVTNIDYRRYLQRGRYFLASVYILKRDVAEPEIDKHVAWGLYNLAAIYYIEGRWSLVVGAAQEGLTQLIKTGKKDYRAKFRQMLAEVWILNQDLLPAIQELDTAIRQDPDPVEAARMFYRVGDIYYGLNNFELSEDVYALGARLDQTQATFNPSQTVLRAESKFWLGKFSDAKGLMTIALNASVSRDKDWNTSSGAIPWIRLRIADTNLALLEHAAAKDRKKLAEDTRLAYFKVESEHPGSEAARIASVRGACMDLPVYEGNNVKHAREFLADVQAKKDVPEVLMEIVSACLVGSYSDRERTPEMVAMVKAFSDKYPNSKFLERMIPAVRDVQATNIEPYFAKAHNFSATEFFEKKRKALYPKVPDDLAKKLFVAYVDTSRPEPAKEFWPAYKKGVDTDDAFLRSVTFLTEADRKTKTDKTLDLDLKKIEKEASVRKWQPELSTQDKRFISRILNSPRSKEQLLWLLPAVETWSKADKDRVCTVTYPLTARIFETRKDAAAMKVVRSKVKEVMAADWPALLAADSACAQSWLDFESHVLSAPEVQVLYSKRQDWKLSGPWLERLWQHSEQLEKMSKHDEAVKIWTRIAGEGPADSFEVKMAKTRLDPNRTEFESLWK